MSVLHNDPIWADVQDLVELPDALVDRLVHYFETYKLTADRQPHDVTIQRQYGREHAYRVIDAAIQDYREAFGD